jgi:hypothetical protein
MLAPALVPPTCVQRTDALRHRRAAQHGRQAQLVAASEKDAGSLVQALQAIFFFGVAAHVEVEHADLARAQAGE